MHSAIRLKGLTKSFTGPTGSRDASLAVRGVDLDVEEHELLVIVGPSGCGKSTILRLIAGVEAPTRGEVYLGDERVDHLPPRHRGVGFMFQGYALFGHLSVAENIGFGLAIKRTPKAETQRRTERLVSLMGLDGLVGHKPGHLSGGQRLRVALARALAPDPKVLLLDEPFAKVDAKVRQRLRVDMKRWQRELKIPTLVVTRDQREALALGDRVAVMNDGRFEQIDMPQNVYDRPATEFVGRFIGRANVFRPASRNGSAVGANPPLEVVIRPVDMSITALERSTQGDRLPADTVASYAFLGRTVRLDVEPGGEGSRMSRPGGKRRPREWVWRGLCPYR